MFNGSHLEFLRTMNFLELDGLKNDPRILQCPNSKSLNKRVISSDTPLMVDERLKDAKQLKQLQQEKKTLTEVKDKINSDPAQA